MLSGVTSSDDVWTPALSPAVFMHRGMLLTEVFNPLSVCRRLGWDNSRPRPAAGTALYFITEALLPLTGCPAADGVLLL